VLIIYIYILLIGSLNVSSQNLKLSSKFWSELLIDELNLKIKILDISENNLKTLPVEIYSMLNIKTIHSRKCILQKISNLDHLIKLTQIDFENNDLEAGSLSILPSSLKILNLSSNHFITIPPAFENLINLIDINMSCNRITSTNGIGLLISLTTINLDDNNLEEISDDIENCTQLIRLSLKRNNLSFKSKLKPDIQSLPEGLFNMTPLDTLSLDGNNLLLKEDLLKMKGIDNLLERRKKLKDKNMGTMSNHSLFGLD
jgi:Leucine-rich repeat (LRR) protein